MHRFSNTVKLILTHTLLFHPYPTPLICYLTFAHTLPSSFACKSVPRETRSIQYKRGRDKKKRIFHRSMHKKHILNLFSSRHVEELKENMVKYSNTRSYRVTLKDN